MNVHAPLRRRLLAAVASSLALALAVFAPQAAAQAADKPIRIGFSMALSGSFAEATVSQLNTYELWKEQTNARGGMLVDGKRRKVEFVKYDDQSKPEQSVRVYEKLITDDKVDLLFAPFGTQFHMAVAPVFEKHKFPVVGNTAASVVLKQVKPGYIWFATSAMPDAMMAQLVAMMKQQGVKNVAIISNVLPFTKELRNFVEPELKKAGMNVTVSQEYPPDIKDMTPMLLKVKQAKPDAILMLCYPMESVQYSRQARELGVNAPFHFMSLGPSDAFYSKAVGKAGIGLITMGHWSPRKEWTGSQAFLDDYRKRFKDDPDYLNSSLSWMSAQITEQAVAKAGLDKQKIRDVIAKDTFDTINGPVRFEGVQNITTPVAFIQLQANGLQLVWPASIATAKFQPKAGWDK